MGNNILKGHLLQIRGAALQAVDPYTAVRQFVHLLPGTGVQTAILRLGVARRIDGAPTDISLPLTERVEWRLEGKGQIRVLAIGKAAAPMAKALMDICGEWVQSGLVVTKYEHAARYVMPANTQVMEAGHPTPDEAGLRAAKAALRLLEGAQQGDHLIVLISGGASALLPSPAPPITLAKLQQTTNLLLRSGANIIELNAVRKHLECLKGGGLAPPPAPASVATLILSDVVGDPLDVIASGPTVPDRSTFQEARDILERYGIIETVPATVQERLRAGVEGKIAETPKPGDPIFEGVTNLLVGSNRLAAQAALAQAQALGYQAMLLSTYIEGEAREVGRLAAALARGMRSHGDPLPPPACLVMGGETTVTVRGHGKGGRNQEVALAAATALAGVPDVAIMALATDGGDGPTDAAGAIVDGNDYQRARAMGLDPYAALANNDAYPLLDVIGALMHTGPTRTNVNDLIVILVGGNH